MTTTTKPRRKPRNLEHAEQVALMDWCKLHTWRTPELALLFAIPNGGKRSPVTAAMLKAEGVKAGVPDLCLPVARKGFHGLYIELKAKGGTMQQSQVQWQQDLNAQGYMAVTCMGWLAARDTLESYLGERVK